MGSPPGAAPSDRVSYAGRCRSTTVRSFYLVVIAVITFAVFVPIINQSSEEAQKAQVLQTLGTFDIV